MRYFWVGQALQCRKDMIILIIRLSQQQNEFEESIEIRVLSRKLKGCDSPSDILFRSHHYDLELIPTEKFFTW